jgi:hypothetical protein
MGLDSKRVGAFNDKDEEGTIGTPAWWYGCCVLNVLYPSWDGEHWSVFDDEDEEDRVGAPV